MGAEAEWQGGKNSHPISRVENLDLGPHFNHRPGRLVAQDHARLPPATFAGKAMHIAATNANRIGANEQLVWTNRRHRSFFDRELPGSIELEDFHKPEFLRRK